MREEFLKLLPVETERLIIKKTTIDDINLILKMDKQEETQKFLGGIKNKSKDERILFLENASDSYTVFLKNGIPIGFINLIFEDSFARLSYIFDYDYCNNGYCTEACLKLIDICFDILNLKSIVADTVDSNNSSKRVLEKLGFKYENFIIKDSVKFLNYIICKDK